MPFFYARQNEYLIDILVKLFKILYISLIFGHKPLWLKGENQSLKNDKK